MLQKELSDRLYMQYIIVFSQWMKLDESLEWNMRIIEFAEKFMRPSSTLCNNPLYAYNLPRYSSNSVATRTILHNMKFFNDLRNVSSIIVLFNIYLLSNFIFYVYFNVHKQASIRDNSMLNAYGGVVVSC